jgi:ribokinase
LGMRERVSRFTVSVLPDFFLDRIIPVTSLHKLFRQIEVKGASGGGNLRGVAQTEIIGGNAANLAFALSSLSAKTNLFCVGNAFTQALLSTRPVSCKVRIISGEPGYTTALEFPFEGKQVNVMLSHVGGISSFDGRKLARSDIEALKRSDCVALVNWSANARGNELADRVFNLPGRERRLNFFDPADIAGAERRIKRFVKNVVDRGLLDVMSLNDNEARIMARLLSIANLPKSYRPDDILKTSRMLRECLKVAVDVHTPIGSASSTDQGEAWADSFGKASIQVTGAGDVWDAGDIIGYLLHLKAADRLRFANACAYLHLTNENAYLPNLREAATLASL